jgi:hypothetical protein
LTSSATWMRTTQPWVLATHASSSLARSLPSERTGTKIQSIHNYYLTLNIKIINGTNAREMSPNLV